MIVYTKSGSRYRVDLDAKTWERLHEDPKSGPLRTPKGSYLEIRLKLGEPLEMLCPPLNPEADARYVGASTVTRMEEE
jgi:hypothetical protein